MKTKLTLRIDDQTIARAKVYAAKSGKSLSKLVESYLNSVAVQAENKPLTVARLSGKLKGKVAKNTDWKQIKAHYLSAKYGS